MKVLIPADAEGTIGIFRKSQATPGGPDYDQFHSLMARNVSAAIRGAFAGGATEAVANDSHNHDDNILFVGLNLRANLMSGIDRPLIMAEGLTEQVDALMLAGYHSRKGARGVTSHTYYYPIAMGAVVNGVPFEGAEFVSHMAGYYGVPTMLLTRDDCVTTPAEKQIPGTHMVMVKKVIDNGSAQLYHLKRTEKLIEKAAKAAVSEYWTIMPVKLEGPMTFTITFAVVTQAVHACKILGFTSSKKQDNVVSYTCDDYSELYEAFLDALQQVTAFNDQC